MADKHLQASVVRAIEDSIAVKKDLVARPELLSTIANSAEVLIQAFQRQNKILIFGNGGSAADAQHIAAELVGRFKIDRAPLPALALNVNTSSLTAVGNDYGFEWVFSRQIEAYARSGDVAMGISTSGRSPNVLHAFRAAKELGVHTIALTGRRGMALADLVDHCIWVPSFETPRIQEAHLLIGHILSELVEAAIFKKPVLSRRSVPYQMAARLA
jgi:D-sedoheptulose 7-phosphate isomerase